MITSESQLWVKSTYLNEGSEGPPHTHQSITQTSPSGRPRGCAQPVGFLWLQSVTSKFRELMVREQSWIGIESIITKGGLFGRSEVAGLWVFDLD